MSDINIQTISVSPTTLSGLTYLLILNGNDSEELIINVEGSSEPQTLASKQTITLSAELNTALPNITLSGNELTANIVTTENN